MSTAIHGTADDFTEAAYEAMLGAAKQRFQLLPICALGVADSLPHGPVALWRHDVDLSPHRARALARMEAAFDIRASYYVLLGSPFYNPLEPAIGDILREISALGHEVGLHYDASLLRRGEHEARIAFEAAILADIIEAPVASFSLHNPGVSSPALFDAIRVAGLINATAPSLRESFTYSSDSNGIWRFRPMPEVVADPAVERLYALTHPEWWTPEPMSPGQRLDRCVNGRAAAMGGGYRALIAKVRPEVLNTLEGGQ